MSAADQPGRMCFAYFLALLDVSFLKFVRLESSTVGEDNLLTANSSGAVYLSFNSERDSLDQFARTTEPPAEDRFTMGSVARVP